MYRLRERERDMQGVSGETDGWRDESEEGWDGGKRKREGVGGARGWVVCAVLSQRS